jgi:hypothetical protein
MATTTLLAGLSILVIGDSHLAFPDHLLNSLHNDLLAQGAQVHSIGVCGSNPIDWVKGAKGTCGKAERIGTSQAKVYGMSEGTLPIKELIKSGKTNLVVIVQGDTIASYDKPSLPKSWIWQQVSTLSREVGETNTKCIWVGPAWGSEGGKFRKTFARVEELSNLIEKNVSPCQYLNSLKLSKPGAWATIDGQHFTAPGYKLWGEAITEAIVSSKGLTK